MAAKMHDNSQVSASWMEHQALEHIKRALRVTVDWSAPTVNFARKRSGVSFTMGSFARHLNRLMAIEEEDGYMKTVGEMKPNLIERIKELRDEHQAFRSRVAQLAAQLDDLEPWQEAEFDGICRDISALLDEVDRHDQAEIRLLQDSLLYDEGGEG